jgi:F0F1-type ATP synthase membrane subunit a
MWGFISGIKDKNIFKRPRKEVIEEIALFSFIALYTVGRFFELLKPVGVKVQLFSNTAIMNVLNAVYTVSLILLSSVLIAGWINSIRKQGFLKFSKEFAVAPFRVTFLISLFFIYLTIERIAVLFDK